MQTFTVRTNRGWGWSIREVPDCPAFGSKADAERYCQLRRQGMAHLAAWDQVEAERHAREHAD